MEMMAPIGPWEALGSKIESCSLRFPGGPTGKRRDTNTHTHTHEAQMNKDRENPKQWCDSKHDTNPPSTTGYHTTNENIRKIPEYFRVLQNTAEYSRYFRILQSTPKVLEVLQNTSEYFRIL